jgi:hypothetical protein
MSFLAVCEHAMRHSLRKAVYKKYTTGKKRKAEEYRRGSGFGEGTRGKAESGERKAKEIHAALCGVWRVLFRARAICARADAIRDSPFAKRRLR